MKIGDKFLCIDDRFSSVNNLVHKKGNTYQILGIKKFDDNPLNNNEIIIMSNEINNDFIYYTSINDYTHYYFYNYFKFDLKSQRKEKLKKINNNAVR